MMRRGSEGAAGYILIETVILGIVVLAAVTAFALFARTVLLEEQAAARTSAAFLAREHLSRMEAELDRGHPPESGTVREECSGVFYNVRAAVLAQGGFYDVTLSVAWAVHGREESVTFVRRMRAHAMHP